MKARILGIISSLTILILIPITYSAKFEFIGVSGFIVVISAELFIFWTKFGKNDDVELIKLEYENQLLREKIKHIELTEELNGLSN